MAALPCMFSDLSFLLATLSPFLKTLWLERLTDPSYELALLYRSVPHGQNTEVVREGRDGEFVSGQT